MQRFANLQTVFRPLNHRDNFHWRSNKSNVKVNRFYLFNHRKIDSNGAKWRPD